MTDYQIGVFALTESNPSEVVLVTSRTGVRWIFPKGQREKGRSDQDVALDEAYEEAGLLGQVSARFWDFKVAYGKTEFLRLYHMKIDEILSSWPEGEERKRAIVPLPQADAFLQDDLRACLHAMLQDLAG